MKIIGPSLFFLEILVAISGSAKLPAAGATYPDTAANFRRGDDSGNRRHRAVA